MTTLEISGWSLRVWAAVCYLIHFSWGAQTSQWCLLALPCLLAFWCWYRPRTHWGELHTDIQKMKVKYVIQVSFLSQSQKITCWYTFAGVWKMKCRLSLNLIFSRKVLSVCPVYHIGMLFAMVINKSIYSENLVLVFQLTCWLGLVNAIVQISSCCNPWKCYKPFYKRVAPNRIQTADT